MSDLSENIITNGLGSGLLDYRAFWFKFGVFRSGPIQINARSSPDIAVFGNQKIQSIDRRIIYTPQVIHNSPPLALWNEEQIVLSLIKNPPAKRVVLS